MKKYLRLKYAAICGLVGIFVLVQFVSERHEEVQGSVYAHYAAKPPAPPEPLPTSDAVPLPACRNMFINLSDDPHYPVPHWVYSLPVEADKALVLAIAKNESRFRPYARSHKGAVGLMQLMPETANYIVQQGGANVYLSNANGDETSAYRPRSPFDFNDPYVSLAVGYRYIAYLQSKRYIGDNLVYTLAAYNAGPGTLLQWKREMRGMSPESFAKNIPYSETRNYIRKVTRDYLRYKELVPEFADTVWVTGESC